MSEVIERYTTVVGEHHRKQLGQFFTEPRVAQFMVDWVTSGGKASLCDPAFGLGAFYSAAKAIGFRGMVYGLEIDSKVISFFRSTENQPDCSIDNVDYLHKWGMRHEAIVCNPPYMRFQKFEGRDRVFNNFESRLGIRLSGYTNIASAFLVKSIFELADGGRLAYIMPLEFLNTGYGQLIKRLLLEEGTLTAIIRMECEREVFPDVTTSVGIILFEKTKSFDPIHFYIAHEVDHLDILLDSDPVSSVDHADLRFDEKWLKYFEHTSQVLNIGALVSLSAYGSFTRGIATGANDFFALTAEQIASLALTAREVVPCITKSAQITSPIFEEKHLKSLVSGGVPVFLLNINGIASNEASKYIAHGEELGLHRRYLTKCRKPWYKLEKRSPSPLLFGVFSRDGFKVIRNYTTALNLTCYHGFSPNIFGTRYIDHLFLYFLSFAGRRILSQNMRKYGDSLDKFEPNDLNVALCPSMEWLEQLPRAEIDEELAHLNRLGKLSERAESMFAKLTDSVRSESLSHIASIGR